MNYSAVEFLLLFPLAIAGWKLLWGREIEGVYVRALGMTLLVSATSTTLELIPFRFLRDVNFPQGGIAGYLLKDLLLPNLNLAGTVLVVATAFVLGVLATTPLTLSGWVGRLSAHDQAMLTELVGAPSRRGALKRGFKVLPRIMPYLGPYRKLAVISVIITALLAVVALAQPWPLAFVVDSIIGHKHAPGWVTGSRSNS